MEGMMDCALLTGAFEMGDPLKSRDAYMGLNGS